MSHIYSGALSRARGLVQRNGLRTVLAKPFRLAFAPWIIATVQKRSFVFQGRQYPLFFHAYNTTWINERCVEIPIIREEIVSVPAGAVLEIGNVLSHYDSVTHDVLDKYEVGPKVINQDVCDFEPSTSYDRIVSISTFEHIGYDDSTDVGSAEKIERAIAKTCSWLSPGGRFVLTASPGWNPHFDNLVRNGLFKDADLFFMKRVGRSEWQECGSDEALEARYSCPLPYGNALVVAVLKDSRSR